MSRLIADFIDTLAGAAGRVMADLTETFGGPFHGVTVDGGFHRHVRGAAGRVMADLTETFGGRFMRVTVDSGFHRHVSGGCRASHGRPDGDIRRAVSPCHG